MTSPECLQVDTGSHFPIVAGQDLVDVAAHCGKFGVVGFGGFETDESMQACEDAGVPAHATGSERIEKQL